MSAGLNPFLDTIAVMPGTIFPEVINTALRVAKVHIAVVSRGFAKSKCCLSDHAEEQKASDSCIL